MKNRVTSESESTVSLFPFLAVLLCTMGALLVLLVVLAQRAGQRVVEQSAPALVVPTGVQQEVDVVEDEAEQLQDELDKLLIDREKLAQLRKKADQRLQDEQQRLSHLEEHTRRLEHELARLALAAEQLLATEQQQAVDQQQAELELERLQQLIAKTQVELEQLRQQSNGKHSYAIVPFQGQYGTLRKPVYIECSKEGVIIQPEGVELEWSDFVATSLPSNPLASAIRATRDHLNARAAQAGAPEPPDPYPLLIVRPNGIKQYQLARAALSSYDENYGYEFVDEDWQLSYPDLPDPQLANVQQHAIMLARERLAQLIRSAPRRFEGLGLASGSHPGMGSGANRGSGYGSGDGDNLLAQGEGLGGSGAGGGWSDQSAVNASEEGVESTGDGSSRENQYGTFAEGTTSGEAAAGEGSYGAQGTADGTSSSAGGPGGTLSSQKTLANQSNLAGQGAAAGSNGGSASQGSAASAGAGAAGGAAGQGATTNSLSSSASSIAETHGQNWATPNQSQGAVPLRRTIEVVVRENQIALLPNRHVSRYNSNEGQVISLNQPGNQVADQFVAALRSQIDEWGLAGSGLYWRPVLKMNVGPDAHHTAERVVRLLQNSGVEITLPETARSPAGGVGHGPQ